jgi:LAO/AO transport system kinase
LLARERDAVAPALNLADDRRPAERAEALALLEILEREAPFPGAARTGITGAPGAGKSTLLDPLVRALRERDESVAVLAVDPSSRHSGGALLGDRIRMRSASRDPGVFIRSMAARDQLGGLSAGALAGVTILGSVFDHVLVETVGVGQSESDVAALVDTLVFVVSPGSGDALQFMKAGLLEWPEIFAVNKSDLGAEAARTASELASGLKLQERAADDWQPPVLRISAREGSGVAELVAALDRHRAHLETRNGIHARRAASRQSHVLQSLVRRYGTYGIEQLGGEHAVLARLGEVSDRGAFALVAELAREVEEALAKR